MKSGLRGGKPRDMATMSHGGKTSRGAGAAQRGYDYDVYRKGGKVKKYAEGNKVTEYGRSRGTESMPEWDVPQYSFSDLFGKKKAQETKPTAVEKPALETPKSDDRGETYAGVPVFQGVEPAPTPAPRPSAPTPSQQRRRAAMTPQPSRAAPANYRVVEDELGGRNDLRLNPAQRAAAERRYGRATLDPDSFMNRMRRAINPDAMQGRIRESSGLARAKGGTIPKYAKGGKVKMASGGTCRGMGAATKGGKYTIK